MHLRLCELAQHNNLLSIVHSRHLIPALRNYVIQQLSRLVGTAAPAIRVCITWTRVWARMLSLLGWMLPLDAAHHVLSNSVPTFCAVCFHEVVSPRQSGVLSTRPVAALLLLLGIAHCLYAVSTC